jgi:hypothetical protein
MWHNAAREPFAMTPRRLAPGALLLTALAGLGFGLLYGWGIRPVEYYDTSPDSLRADYRTDYVLMVAEAYQADPDLARAQQRLAALGPARPLDMVTEAIEFAADHGFPRPDLERLAALSTSLREIAPTPEIGSP